MLKYIVIASLLVALAYGTTCASNPVLPLLRQFITSHDEHMNNPNRKYPNETDDGTFDGDALLTAYESSSGTAVNNLSKCTSYNSLSDPTCCTNDLVSLFPKLTKGFFRRRMGKPPKSQKLIRTVYRLAKKCGADMTGTDLQSSVRVIITETRTCQKQALTADVNMLRGTLCAICVPPADFDTYFVTGSNAEDLQIKVVEAQLASYDTKMQEGLSCFDNQKTALSTLITETVDAWDQEKCGTQADRIKEILADEAEFGTRQCRGDAKPLKDEGCLNETEDDGTTHPEVRGGPPGPGERRGPQRLLTSSTGGYVADVAGLDSIYLEDSAENTALLADDFVVEDVDDSGFEGPEDPVDPAPNSGIIAKAGLGLVLIIALLF